jgi:hypothetical protein
MTMMSRVSGILKRRSLADIGILAADRVLRPLGFSLLSYTRCAAVPPVGDDFDSIARENTWGSVESLSGPGSEVKQSATYRGQLAKLLPRFKSMFDAPCGDMNWMRLVLDEVDIAYTGGDISPYIIELNRVRYPELTFEVFDISRDRFPKVDLWHCRDCLFHLSNDVIWATLKNFACSDIHYALITTHRGVLKNVDIETGGWRYLSLTRPPFNLPEPELALRDYRFGEFPRFLGLWKRETIRSALS